MQLKENLEAKKQNPCFYIYKKSKLKPVLYEGEGKGEAEMGRGRGGGAAGRGMERKSERGLGLERKSG